MKIKSFEIGTIKLQKNKWKIIAVLLFCCNLTTSTGQTVEWIDNGTYQFDTDFPNSDLHFYLFDDGHHSFDKNPIHEYQFASIPATPILYHSEPYTNDDPTETSFTGVDDGVISASAPAYLLDNQIQVKRSWNMVEDKENYFLLMFENSIGDESISGCVEFHYTKYDISIEIEDILDDYGNDWVENINVEASEYNGYTTKVVWEFNNLTPGEQRVVYIPAKCLQDVFSRIDTRGVFKVDDCDAIIPENSKLDGSNEEIFDAKIYTLESIVSNFPNDPNCVVTNPKCIAVAPGAQTINYKIYFQNDGIHPVENVWIDLRSFGELNFDNIRIKNASAPCELSWSSNEFNIVFFDIYLPGMAQNPQPVSYDETVGWVELELCFHFTEVQLQITECFNTDGKITFDEQPPLPISNVICKDVSCIIDESTIDIACPESLYFQQFNDSEKVILANKEFANKDFEIVPNVSSTEIRIKGFNVEENLNVSILSVTSGLIKEIEINGSSIIDVKDIPNGVYYIRIGNKTKQFVKI